MVFSEISGAFLQYLLSRHEKEMQNNMKTSANKPLTLEEKLWFDKRKSEIEQYAAFGAGVGAASGAAITSLGPFPRRMQILGILGGIIIGGGSGYLYADSQAIARVENLSASSRLRKEYQQMQLEKKAAKKADEGVVKLSPKGQAIETKSA